MLGCIIRLKEISVISSRFLIISFSLCLFLSPDSPCATSVSPLPESPGSGLRGRNSPVSVVTLSRSDKSTGLNKDEDFSNFAGRVIDTVMVRGNRNTKPRTIVRIMASKQGEELVPEHLERDLSYLYGLGYFSSVDITVRESGQGGCTILVRVTERPDLFLKYPYPVLDYDFEKGLKYGIKWKIENFRGLAEHVSVEFKKRAEEEHSGGASWYIPWFLGRRLRFNLDLFNYRKLDEPESNDFIKSRSGISVRMGFPLSRSFIRQIWFFPSISLEDRESRLSLPQNINYPAGVFLRQSLSSTGFSLIYDSRNRNIDPTSGAVSRFYVNYVRSLSGHDQNYTFYELRHRNFIPVSGSDTFILAFDIFNRDGELPSFFEMGMGGHSDLRGYNSKNRATSKILGSFQWRKLVFGPREFNIPRIGKFDLKINITGFVDTGALTDSFLELKTSDFYSTGGAGLEIVSPLQNLLRLEYATDMHGGGGIYFVSGSKF